MRGYLKGVMAGLLLGAVAASVVYGRRSQRPLDRVLGQARRTLRVNSRNLKRAPARLVKLARRYR